MMQMYDYFVFDGVSSVDFGMYAFGHKTLGVPAVDMTEIVIPGRNGVLHQYNDRFGNVSVQYSVVGYEDEISKNIPLRVTDMLGFLASRRGYCRLEDSFRPEEYRMAVYKGGETPSATQHDEAAGMVLTFNCRPERWLKSGEISVDCVNGSVLFNPTYFTAKPMLRAYGTGTLTVVNSAGSTAVKINIANTYTDIDCELQEAYKGTTNCNGNIQLPNGGFPVFTPGENRITLSGISKVEVTPRWYKI